MLEKPWTLVLDLRGYGLNYSMNILISIRFFYCFYSHFNFPFLKNPFLNMNKKKSSQKVFWSGQSFSLKLRLFEKQKISVTGWKTQFQSVQLFLCFVVSRWPPGRTEMDNARTNWPNYPESHQRQTKKNTKQTQKQTKKLEIWVLKMIFVLGISKDRIPAEQVTWSKLCELAKCQPSC